MSDGSEERKIDTSEETYLAVCLEDIMMKKSGRHFIWWLLSQYGVFQSPFDSDAITLAHRVGFADAGRLLMTTLLEVCPDYYNVMMQEHTKEMSSE